jgi:lipoprotein-anchoring transpeptidase ErfK/SrfK
VALVALLTLVPGSRAQDPGLSPPAPGLIADGVSIDGVDVAGLDWWGARAKLLRERVGPRREPIEFTIGDRTVTVNPALAGYVARVDYALKGAANFGRTQPLRVVDVPLRQRVDMTRLRRILDWHERRVAQEPVNARREFVDGRPVVSKPVLGVELRQPSATRVARRAILERTADRAELPTRRYRPERTGVGFSVVIDRDAFDLRLYRGEDLVRTLKVGVGMPSHPTPVGEFRVVNMERNPTWNPPDSRWAEGIGPIPPGPENPLGTRWIGISSPAIGLHGTPAPETVGRRSSHGCIRLPTPRAEWLYNIVDIGTPVVIV